jgi:hypothetical protein
MVSSSRFIHKKLVLPFAFNVYNSVLSFSISAGNNHFAKSKTQHTHVVHHLLGRNTNAKKEEKNKAILLHSKGDLLDW